MYVCVCIYISHIHTNMCLVSQSCMSSSVHGDSPGKNPRVGCHALPPRDLPDPGTKPRSPTLQADSLLSEPSWKPTYIHTQ